MKVRDRASVSLPEIKAGTIESFRQAVKHERQVELAFEDHRYWDLLRWKDASTVLNEPLSRAFLSEEAVRTMFTVLSRWHPARSTSVTTICLSAALRWRIQTGHFNRIQTISRQSQ